MSITKVFAMAVVVLAALVSACSQPSDQSSMAASSSTTPASPYPRMLHFTEVSVPLEPRVLAAAEFALEMYSETEALLARETSEAYKDRYFGRATPEAVQNLTPWENPPGFVAKTGAWRVRVVAARELEYGTVEVSICTYNSPGIYTVFEDGRVVGPPEEGEDIYFSTPVVQYTDRPAANGAQPGFTRWLWADRGLHPEMSMEEKVSICDPFKPDPFVQEMPEPKPTRTPSATRPGPIR